MKIVTASNGKQTVKISKSEWLAIGKKAGWDKDVEPASNITTGVPSSVGEGGFKNEQVQELQKTINFIISSKKYNDRKPNYRVNEKGAFFETILTYNNDRLGSPVEITTGQIEISAHHQNSNLTQYRVTGQLRGQSEIEEWYDTFDKAFKRFSTIVQQIWQMNPENFYK